MKEITIGARGSKLSIIQVEIIRDLLKPLISDTRIIIKPITTKGDKNMSPVPLDSVGKGWFTKTIDKEVLNGGIDIAVHSLKDLSEELAEGLVIAAIPEREDAREALVTTSGLSLTKLPKGAVIGTDSTRRKTQILHKRPDLRVESVRGNVLTRLEKLDSGQYDGLLLAVAGLKRLSLEKRIAEYFSEDDFIPSPGQGALAVVTKKTNTSLNHLLERLNHEDTVTEVTAERSFSKAVGGGCKLPVGAYAKCFKETITIQGVIGSLDGMHLERRSITGEKKKANSLATKLGKTLLSISNPWYQPME